MTRRTSTEKGGLGKGKEGEGDRKEELRKTFMDDDEEDAAPSNPAFGVRVLLLETFLISLLIILFIP